MAAYPRATVPAVLATLLTLLLLPSARTEEANWEALFGSLDPERAYGLLRDAEAEKKDPALPPRLFAAALEAAHPHLAVSCGDTLRRIGGGWSATSAFAEVLEEAVSDRSVLRRLNLARVLGAWGTPAADAALARLAAQRRAPDVRTEALLMAGALPSSDASAFPAAEEAIRKGLTNRHVAVRRAACIAAGRRRLEAAVPKLVSLALRDSEPWVGALAVRALGRIGAPVDLEVFAKALRRKRKPPVRAACLKAITTLVGPEDAGLLLSLLKSRDDDVRHAAILAVHTLAAPDRLCTRVDGAEGLADVEDQTVKRVAEALSREVFGDDVLWRRHAALHALGRMGTPAARVVGKEAVRHLKDRNPESALVAVKLCARLGLVDAYPTVLALALGSEDLAVRLAAARGLGLLDAQQAASDLLARVKPGGRLDDATRNAVEGLAYLAHRDAIVGLVDLLEREGWSEEGLVLVETALERLTGHRFGTSPAVWRAWIDSTKHLLATPRVPTSPAARRREVAASKRYHFRPRSDRAMERGLRWLERMQHACGYWSGGEDGLDVKHEHQTTFTSFALLAFLGAGYKPDSGRYREAVWRASEFLAAVHRFDGRSPDRVVDREWYVGCYFEALGCFVISSGLQALVEAYACSGDTTRRGVAQRGMDYLGHIALPEQGWGRLARDEAVTSSTGLLFLAACSGAGVGLEVDPWGLDGADSRLNRCTTEMAGTQEDPADRSPDFGHTVGGGDTFFAFTSEYPLTASTRQNRSEFRGYTVNELAMLVRFVSGWERSHPAVAGWARYLAEAPPHSERGPLGPPITWIHVHWWLGSWAMFQMGGSFWRTWSERLTRVLCEHQRLGTPEIDGSWDPAKARTSRGRLFATSTAVLALQSWYRQPPFLAR